MKIDLLINNSNIATFENNQLGVLEKTSLGIHNNEIVSIGQKQSAHKEFDAEGKWLLPSFIDCHTHIVYAGNRRHEFALRMQGESYENIANKGGGINATVNATRMATAEFLLQTAKERIATLMAEGVAIIEIKSGYGLDYETEEKILQVAKKLEEQLPIKVVKTFLGAHCLAPEFKHKTDYIHFLTEEVLPKLKQKNLVDFIDGFCESIAFSHQELAPLFTKAQALKIPIKLHAEQLSNSGASDFAAKMGAISVEHLEYATEAQIAALKKAGSIAVLLPGAFYFMQEKQKPPVELFRKYKVPMALASDSNPGTSPVTSLLLMLNMGAVLFGLTPLECLQGITIHAASALNLDKEFGSLAIGKKALGNLWDITHPYDLVYNIGYKPKLITLQSLLL